MTEKNTALLSLIRGAETSRGYEDYSRYATVKPPKPMTQMTVSEVRAWQRQAVARGSKSVAAGGYQIIGGTMKGVIREMGLSGNELFDEDLQDRMGMHLLNRRGYNDWINGSMSDEDFGNSIAKEWAGLPVVSGNKKGRSYYAGDGLNGANAGVDTVFSALAAGRSGEAWEFVGGGGGYSEGATVGGEGTDFQLQDDPQTREEILNGLSVDENYTGADMAPVNKSMFPQYRSVLDDRKAAAQAPEKPSFWDAAKMAIDEEQIMNNVARQMGRTRPPIDRDFQYSEDLWKELSDGLGEAYHNGLEDAVSEDHARALAKELKRSQDVDSQLASMGWGGIGLRLGAAIADPAAIAISAVTATAAAPLIYGAKATRMSRFLKAGTAGAAVNASIDGYLVSQDPAAQWGDVAFSAAAGFILGGASGAIRRMPEDAEMDAVLQKGIIDEAIQQADGSVGAARVPTDPDLSVSETVRAESADAPTTAKPLGAPRIDRVGVLKQSVNGITRRVSALLGEDGVGNADGSVNVISASEKINRETRVRLSRFYRDHNEAYRGWLKEKNLKWWQHGAATRREFNTAVGKAVRRPIDAEGDPHINRVASRIKEESNDLLNFGKDYGIRGFDQIKDNYNYMMRRFRVEQIDEIDRRFGKGMVNRLVAESIQSAQRKRMNRAGSGSGLEEIDYEDALKISEAYVSSIRSRRYGDFATNRALAGDDVDTLQMMLNDYGMAPADVQRISDKVRMTANNGEKGRLGVAKWRLDLDETYTIDVRMADGTKKPLGFEDLLENDAELLFTNYSRSVLGAGYTEEALSNFKVPDAEGNMPAHAPSFETIKKYVREEAQANNVSERQMTAEMRYLDNLYSAVKGIPVERPTNFNEAQRFFRDYNFSRIGGQLGVAGLAEIGNPLGNGGLRVLMQNIPSLRRVFVNAATGKFSDDFFNESEAIWGFGTELHRNSPNVKFDDSLGSFEGAGGRFESADHFLQRTKKVTSVASGLAHVNMVLQRLNARVLVQRFMDDATGTRSINQKRMRVMGISDEMHPRIQEQMRKHVDQSKGLLGRKVQRINIEKWDDVEAKNAFINGVDRWAKKSIQENDVGNMPDFMSYELGKTIGQFRSFMMAAYTKQLLAGMHHRDWETLSSFLTSMFFGGIFYAAQQSINSVGREDREEFLEDRLSTSSIAKASFQRAGFSSVLPMVADFTVGFAGVSPIFDYRSSGLSGGGGGFVNSLISNPTADLVNGAFNGAQGIGSAMLSSDYDFSQQDFRNVSKVFLLQNAFGIRNGLAAIGGTLPKYSQ